ncbi:putative tyrosine-protein kinase in cps region [Andreprevotia sp. IGB-42]|uniref:polysaccharide biosynthesis tyrosine autokinase n=1 Tax=Andreprevotia sp. IGB-42 TaxID=2497473 RepID=UPI00135BF437|nr:polysaccharide biosynthesis tyrosine autokinase [Andreprevotia sp. IGB-42]KAF0815387.1 putative tyrosine-protein kinase in cps region [Andreprevotia sp. IGB-42]
MNTPNAIPLPQAHARIGTLLLERGSITQSQAALVLEHQRRRGLRFGEAAVELGLVSDADIRRALSAQFDYSYAHSGESSISPLVTAACNPFSPEVEALRSLRSQLLLRWFEAEQHALMVVGSEAGPSASILAANLAVVFSQMGERTLLVDANLRQPQQQTLFDLKGRHGLTDLMAGRAEPSTCIQQLHTLPGLSILAAGTQVPNPQELLSRQEFALWCEQLAQQFDVVLFDAPSLSLGADAQLIGARARGALLLAQRNKTAVADVAMLRDQLRVAGTEVVGCVLDKARH